ncbi:MAG: endonuclease/exonuclease/phosphatase family protein [Bacilli bacterium]|nr:endonuclease/exonuclease/phosphatase family protein [Bacilli bacterium]
MKIMTFNLKNDGLFIFGKWKKRLKGFVNLIKEEKPDIIGTQEMTYKAKKRLEKLLKENNLQYNFYGESRNRNHRTFDEYNCILVNSKIKVLKTNTFSLSETPLIPKTKFKNDKFPRIITEIETKEFYLYNTHLSNKVDKNKMLQLKCITNLLKKDKPIIMTGDFNLGIKRIKNFCEKNNFIDTTKNIGKTFTTKKEIYHLDHILIDKNLKFENPIKHDYKYKNKYISDHYPVSVEIKK